MISTFLMTFGLSHARPACYLGFVEHHEAYAKTPTELHDHVDWRANMSKIKNQGDCGSCYAESAVGTFEAAWSLTTGRIHNFSVQEAIDCSSKQGNQGCGGGWMHSVYQWIIDGHGILLDSQDPYVAMDQNCSNKSGSEIAYLKNWSYVHPSQLALLHWITRQPVSIAVDANECWESYSGGRDERHELPVFPRPPNARPRRHRRRLRPSRPGTILHRAQFMGNRLGRGWIRPHRLEPESQRGVVWPRDATHRAARVN